ncbi:MAG: glycosyltransferase [Patescibacteria group bacterium]|nr:glycosyltransferase [Patescibacteria group bacterium]
MRILMLSRDGAGLERNSGTAKRWRLLRDAGAELDVIVASSKSGDWKEDRLSVSSSKGNFLTKWFKLWLRTQYAVRSTKYDLITAQDPFELGLVGYLLARKTKVSFEIQDHGGFFDGEETDEPLWFLRSCLALRIARRARRIRTVSPKSLDVLQKSGLSEKIYLLPIAADMRFAELQREPEPFHVVSVGRLVSVKNFDSLINAFSAFKQKHPEAKLTIVGEGSERKKLEGLIDDLRLAGSVFLPGAGDPAPFLTKAAVFVLLSKHEGWGIASVEAALAGVPVVMTDTGCARWLEERNAALIVGSDFRDFQAAVEKAAGQLECRLARTEVHDFAQTARIQVAKWRELC